MSLRNDYLSTKIITLLICSYISGPSKLLLDKRNSIDASSIKLLFKSFNDG